MKNVKIIIATHKKYWMPSDEIYLPILVGAENKKNDLDYIKDNTGINISNKNKNYCELTGLYWAWKNLDAEYIGLAHYRRHFSTGKIKFMKKSRILTFKQVQDLISDNDIILPKPRNYYIETNYSQYVHAHHAIDLDTTRVIISERHPEYLEEFDKYMKKTIGHRFNMFIMSRDRLNEYCEWLFDILFELENRLNISTYNDNDSRVFGFVSERLLDVWINTNKYKYINIPYIFMENQNWINKGFSFIKRKFITKVG